MGWLPSIFGRRNSGARPVLKGGHMLPPPAVVHSGTRWSGGAPSMEDNPQLRDLRSRTRHLQQMERTDPTLHALVSLVIDTACEATPVAIPRKVSEADRALHEQVCEDVRLMFGWEGRPSKLIGAPPHCSKCGAVRGGSTACPDGGTHTFPERQPQTWETVCRHLMLAAPYGFSVAPWFTYAGEGGKPWVSEFALVDLASVWRWVRDDKGRISGWEQYAESGQAHHKHSIALDNCVLVTHRSAGDDPEGAGTLRACYAHHALKRQAVESTGQTTDRAGVPPVVVEYDHAAMLAAGYTDDQANELREAAEVQAARFNRKDGGRLTELAGIRFRFMDTAFSPQALLEVEARCDEAFAFAHHAAYTRLGIAQSGAENVGQVQRDTFLRFVASRLDDVLDALTVQCIAPVIRRRYGERGARLLPMVTHKGLRPHPLSQLQAFVPGALAAGAMRASEQMQDAFNELAGLPADAGRDSDEAQAMAEAGHAQANTGNVHAQVPGPGRGHVGEATTTERNARLQQIVDSMSDEGAQDG